MVSITAQIPSADMVKMGVILDISQQVIERWKRVNSCKRCQLSRPMLQTLASASNKIVTLHEAASVQFADQDGGEPTPRSESCQYLPHTFSCFVSYNVRASALEFQCLGLDK